MSKIKSNVETDKEIEPLFDYGDITDRDKSVVEEVINLLQARPGVPSEMVIAELKEKFTSLAKYLEENETKIVSELNTTQGHHVDIGGYYHPDNAKMTKAMRPSETLNKAIDGF